MLKVSLAALVFLVTNGIALAQTYCPPCNCPTEWSKRCCPPCR